MKPSKNGGITEPITTAQIEDNGDTITVKESYLIEKIGKYERSLVRSKFFYSPKNISNMLRHPKKLSKRTMPYGLSYPLRYKTKVRLDVPEAEFESYDKEIKSDYHIYRQKGEYVDDIFEITFEYQTLKDHVPVEDLKQFSDEIDEMDDEDFIRIVSSGKNPTAKLEVYQPAIDISKIASQETFEEIRFAVMDLLENLPPTYTEYRREEIADILAMEGFSPPLKRAFLSMMATNFRMMRLDDEALHYYDMLNKLSERVGAFSLVDQAGIYERKGQYKKAIKLIERAIKQKVKSPASRYSQKWHKRLRRLQWKSRDFDQLIPTLEYLKENHEAEETIWRELGVAYELGGFEKKAKDLRLAMKDHGFKDLPVKLPDDDDEKPRKPRPLFKEAPVYPFKAQQAGKEGYVIVEFTINKKGETSNCTVVESKPEKLFNEAACTAANNFYYYPVSPQEPAVDLHQVAHKITFKMEE